MSTFMGRVAEFPEIQIDYFRRDSQGSPLACFLSHVHSDHLSGLVTLRSPFVYCSAATKEILLRLETYACRINYAKGVLEAEQQTYKHLSKILKPLPLDTPTCLELRPGLDIQVTLFDANHCPGAVMFLVEGSGMAILYTGDIRSEPWFVNSLVRNPNLIEYASGIRRLDKIYLDTSFTRDTPFQTKAEGIAELLRKVSQYSPDTVFHFQAWTYGYEEVWIALSRALKSPIHVDDYKMRVYSSLRIKQKDDRFSGDVHLSPEAPALVGYMSGNRAQPGCLTSDPNVRLHSCEKGNMCAVARGPCVVRIQPVIAHLSNGADLAEVGAGGGGGDLEREAGLDLGMMQDIQALGEMISELERDSDDKGSISKAREHIVSLAIASPGKRSAIPLHINVSRLGEDQTTLLKKTVDALAHRLEDPVTQPILDTPATSLPSTIRFPYSRHSSYPELCHMLDVFRPRDVWPCTVDEREWLEKGLSIASLFGQHCSGTIFSFDESVMKPMATRADEREVEADTQRTGSSAEAHNSLDIFCDPPPVGEPSTRQTGPIQAAVERMVAQTAAVNPEKAPERLESSTLQSSKRVYDEYLHNDEVDHGDAGDAGDSQSTERSMTTGLSTRHSLAQREAYYNMLEYMNNDVWTPIGLISTGDNHTDPEKEL